MKSTPLGGNTVAEIIASEPFLQRKHRTWLDALTPELQEGMLDLRRKLHRREGKFANATISEVCRRLKDKFNLAVSEQHLRKWLAQTDERV